MYRNELKYVINPATAAIISSRLELFCDYDNNCDEKGFYKVSSLYFDDYCNSSLNDNIIGQSNRKKFRIRVYNGSDTYIRLEKKIKHNKGGKKEACPLTKDQYAMVQLGNYKDLDDTADTKLLKGFCLEGMTRGLKPKVIVEYNRKSFVYSYGDIRVTLDYDIKHSSGSTDLFDDEQIYAPAVEPGQVVLEVKYTGYLPEVIKNLVQQSVVTQTGISKYSISRMCYQ